MPVLTRPEECVEPYAIIEVIDGCAEDTFTLPGQGTPQIYILDLDVLSEWENPDFEYRGDRPPPWLIDLYFQLHGEYPHPYFDPGA
jgi:hypothetical protein